MRVCENGTPVESAARSRVAGSAPYFWTSDILGICGYFVGVASPAHFSSNANVAA